MRSRINRLLAIGASAWLAPALAMFVYAVAMLWALDQFPIYFFTDEAMNPVLAEEILTRGLRDRNGAWLPLYFELAADRWMPLLSAYVHMFPVALFGKSIVVARFTQVVVSAFGALAVGLILKVVFRVRHWWLGILLMAATPAWFLHSRTAFETVMMASFYAWFLLTYLLYRTRSPSYLVAAVLFGAATFYTYSNGQAVMLAVAASLLVSDFRYHVRQRWAVASALALAVILALPAVGFRLDHPAAVETHLRVLGSYWVQPIGVEEKLLRFAQTYLGGLSPLYWFFPTGQDLARHQIKGHGHLSEELLPLVLVGVVLCLRRIRSSPHRAVLLGAVAAPIGAATAGVTITRVMAFIPPAILLAGLGCNVIMVLLAKRLPAHLVGALTFILLTAPSLVMLRDSITDGPLWFRDYGLYGMQYGAKQLFQEAIPDLLHQDPQVRVFVSPNWANGTNVFPRFFLTPAQRSRVQLRSGNAYLEDKLDLGPDDVVVMTADEFDRARVSPKLGTVEVQRVIPYPDGRPGFYFTRLAYAADADALFESERQSRRQPVDGELDVEGRPVRIRYSRLGAGQPRDLFDGDRFTLIRGLEANPLVIELFFVEPRAIAGVSADLGTMDYTLAAHVTTRQSGGPLSYESTERNVTIEPHVELPFDDGLDEVTAIRIEIRDLRRQGEAQIHVRELKLR